MTNAEIAKIFENIASLLELRNDAIFKVLAYQRAARTIAHLPIELRLYVQAGKDPQQLPAIGNAISKKLYELVATGTLRYYEELKREFPPGLLKLMDIPSIGPKTAMNICRELRVSSVEDLEKAAIEGRLAALPGLGDKSVANHPSTNPLTALK